MSRKNCLTSLVTGLLLIAVLAPAQAAGLKRVGLATYQVLGDEYYIGALYLEGPAATPDEALALPGAKRMEMRVTIDTWRSRAFTTTWLQALNLNNSPADLKPLTKEVQAFANILEDKLAFGDRMVIAMAPGKGTLVSIDGIPVMQVNNDAFFNVLLRCWVGAKPPSSDFKQDILKITAKSEDLADRYNVTTPDPTRKAAIAAWPVAAATAKILLKQEAAPVAAAPAPAPVVATKPEPVPAPVAKVEPPKPAPVPAPAVPAKPEPAPAPVAKVEPPKPAPAVPAKPEPAPVAKVEPPKPAPAPAPAPVAAAPAPAPAVATKPEPAPVPVAKVEPPKPAPAPAPAPTPVAAAPAPAPAPVAAAPAAVAPIAIAEADTDEVEGPPPADALLKTYRAYIMRDTYKKVRYPDDAIARNQEGDVGLSITVLRNGTLVSVEVTAKSFPALNGAATRAAQAAAPYMPAPDALPGDRFTFEIPIRFKVPH